MTGLTLQDTGSMLKVGNAPAGNSVNVSREKLQATLKFYENEIYAFFDEIPRVG